MAVNVVAAFPSQTMQLHIANLGGVVLKAMVVVIEGHQACMGFLPPTAFLRPGEIRLYDLELEATNPDKATAVVYGFDATRQWAYAWSANGKSHRWPTRASPMKPAPDISAVEILEHFYPGSPDPFSLELRPTMKLI